MFAFQWTGEKHHDIWSDIGPILTVFKFDIGRYCNKDESLFQYLREGKCQ